MEHKKFSYKKYKDRLYSPLRDNMLMREESLLCEASSPRTIILSPPATYQNKKIVSPRLYIPAILVLLIFLQACAVTKKYQRPVNVVDEKLYRTDMIQTDTANLADLTWKQMFTDAKLTNYIQQALQNNLDIRIAIQQIAAAEAYMKQGRAAFFPTLSAGPSVMYQTGSLNTALGQMADSRQHAVQYEIGANLSWEADIWGKIKSNERALVANYLRTESAHQAVKSQLVATIADTYYQLMALDEQKKITEETIITREKNAETTKALKQAGTLTEVAVKQSEALLLNARGILVNLENNIKLLENFFSVLLGISPQAIDRNNLEMQSVSTDLAIGVPAQLLRNRPDVRAAEYQFVNAFELTNVAKANFYPALRISAGSGLQSVDIDKLFSVGSLFGSAVGSLIQPIINQRQIRTQHEVALTNQQISYLNYRKTILTAGREVSDALFSFNAQSELISIKQREYESYAQATDFSQQLVNHGMANYLEVLRAAENELQARLNYVNARYGELSAIVQLYRALGGGWK